MEKRAKSRRHVILPIDGRDDLLSAEIRGGKGTSLAVMQKLGLRVPPAFTVSTTVMRAYCVTGVLPKRVLGQLIREMEVLERKTGKIFGDRNSPLLVSVRSGAATSMPGMMDTILNLGITDGVLSGFADRGEEELGRTLYERFTKGWQETVSKEGFSAIPNDPWQQLSEALIAVIGSWDNPRAKMYREHHGINHMLGTAVNVQAMVYGNRDEKSGTGVVFSHNVNTGTRGLYGEFLPCAQGEEVVSGIRTPHLIEFLKGWDQPVYEELERAVMLLATHEQSMVEVEFTIESGVLYFLQHRKAKATLEARITSIVHEIWEKKLTHGKGLSKISPEEISEIASGKTFEQEAFNAALAGVVMRGIPASPGVASGRVAFTSEEAVARSGQGERVILFRPDTNPDDLPGMLAADGIITLHGGATCHAAVVARALGKPAVVGAGTVPPHFGGDVVSLDGSLGVVVPGSIPVHEASLKKEVSLFVKWYRKIHFPKPRYDSSWKYRSTSVTNQLGHVYLLELMAHEAKGTELAFEAESLRCEWYTQTADLFLCYLLFSVKKELRHVEDKSTGSDVQLNAFLEHHDLDALTVGQVREFFELAVSLFRDHEWNRSFGGEAWAVIAETALWFVEEKIGHTVFVDRVFDLQHNTGRVFNKDLMVVANDAYIGAMLNLKKVATSSLELEHKWVYSYGVHISPKVNELRQKGLQLNIWR